VRSSAQTKRCAPAALAAAALRAGAAPAAAAPAPAPAAPAPAARAPAGAPAAPAAPAVVFIIAAITAPGAAPLVAAIAPPTDGRGPPDTPQGGVAQRPTAACALDWPSPASAPDAPRSSSSSSSVSSELAGEPCALRRIGTAVLQHASWQLSRQRPPRRASPHGMSLSLGPAVGCGAGEAFARLFLGV